MDPGKKFANSNIYFNNTCSMKTRKSSPVPAHPRHVKSMHRNLGLMKRAPKIYSSVCPVGHQHYSLGCDKASMLCITAPKMIFRGMRKIATAHASPCTVTRRRMSRETSRRGQRLASFLASCVVINLFPCL